MISHSVLCLTLIRARAQQSLQSVKPYVYTTLDWGYFNGHPTEKLLTAFCLSRLLCNPSALHRIADVAEDTGPSQVNQVNQAPVPKATVRWNAQAQGGERGSSSFSNGSVPVTPG